MDQSSLLNIFSDVVFFFPCGHFPSRSAFRWDFWRLMQRHAEPRRPRESDLFWRGVFTSGRRRESGRLSGPRSLSLYARVPCWSSYVEPRAFGSITTCVLKTFLTLHSTVLSFGTFVGWNERDSLICCGGNMLHERRWLIKQDAKTQIQNSEWQKSTKSLIQQTDWLKPVDSDTPF